MNRMYEDIEEIQAIALFLKNPLALSKILNRDFHIMVMD